MAESSDRPTHSEAAAVSPNVPAPSMAPRTILVVDDGLYLKLENDPRLVHLLDDREAMVVPYRREPTVNSTDVLAVRDLLLASGQLTRDALLVKNPYDSSSYELAQAASEAFTSAKYHVVAVVAGLLGAKEMRIVEARVDRTTLKWNSDNSVKLPLFGGGGKASRDVSRRLEKSLEARTEFEGSDPQPAEALAYLRSRNLQSDTQLRTLIDLRSIGNRTKSYTLIFSGTRESASNLKTALDLASAIPTKKGSVGASFTRGFQSVSTIEIKTEITF